MIIALRERGERERESESGFLNNGQKRDFI